MLEKLHFDDFEDFVIEVTENYDAIKDNDEGNDVTIIAKYAEATDIIENLIQCGYKIEEIQIKIPEYGGYEDEYVISLCNVNGSDIWCEPMKRENGYLDNDSAVIYVMDNCSSTALKHLDSEAILKYLLVKRMKMIMSVCVNVITLQIILKPVFHIMLMEMKFPKKNMIKLLTECVMRLMKQDRNIMNLRIL